MEDPAASRFQDPNACLTEVDDPETEGSTPGGAPVGSDAAWKAEVGEGPAPRTAGGAPRARLFISYKHDSDPDETIALQVFQALCPNHDVFIDQTMLVGARWAERIEAELRRADFLIPLLSAQSIHSEMVLGEIEKAHHLAKERAGRPAILPVRLAYREPFQYPLSAYLNQINWAFWKGPDDTARLIEELTRAIAGTALMIGTKQSKADLIRISESVSPLSHCRRRSRSHWKHRKGRWISNPASTWSARRTRSRWRQSSGKG